MNIMQQFVADVVHQLNLHQVFQKAHYMYRYPLRLEEYKSPQQILDYFAQKHSKYLKKMARQKANKESQTKKEESWKSIENQMFAWVCICYSALINKPIHEFNEEERSFLYQIFSNKQEQLIKYSIASLIRIKSRNRQEWSQSEERLFLSIVIDQKLLGKWRQISTRLYKQSENKCFKSSKRCREKWYNYMNPTINKNEWSPEEDLLLLKLVEEHGKRWSQISRIMKNTRSQHMVKNRFVKLQKIVNGQKRQRKTRTTENILKSYAKKNQRKLYKKRTIQTQKHSQNGIDHESNHNFDYIQEESDSYSDIPNNQHIKKEEASDQQYIKGDVPIDHQDCKYEEPLSQQLNYIYYSSQFDPQQVIIKQQAQNLIEKEFILQKRS